MATEPKKTARKPAARKSTARKPAASTATRTADTSTARTATTSTATAPAVDTATVKIGTRRGYHDIAVNGKARRVRTGEEITVNAAELEVLQASSLDVSVIQPIKGQDAPADSGSEIGGTAFRGEEREGRDAVTGEPQEPAELRQVTDEQLKNSSQAEAAKAAGLDPADGTATA